MFALAVAVVLMRVREGNSRMYWHCGTCGPGTPGTGWDASGALVVLRDRCLPGVYQGRVSWMRKQVVTAVTAVRLCQSLALSRPLSQTGLGKTPARFEDSTARCGFRPSIA